MTKPRVFGTRYPVSASLQVADVDGDGSPEVIVASRKVWSVRASGPLRPKTLLKGGRPFASTACVIDDGGRPDVLIGCDDGALYSTARQGPLVRTGLDIYSSPVAFRHEGRTLIAFGSDDGGIWCVDRAGKSVDGFPVKCGAFVSATPAVGDFDGDGAPEILVGDWAGRFHALRADGSELPGFPIDLGFPIWSSAAMGDIDGDGEMEAAVATRRLHAIKRSGGDLPGFPRLLGSYTVGSPIIVDLLGDGRAAVVVGSDRLYAFDALGRALPGFPYDLFDFNWASPVAAESKDGGAMTLFIGGWDDDVYEVRCGLDEDGELDARPTELLSYDPYFAAAALVDRGAAGATLAAASWEGRLQLVDRPALRVTPRSWPTFHRTPTNERVTTQRFEKPSGAAAPRQAVPSGPVERVATVHNLAVAEHRRATFIRFEGKGLENVERAQLIYRVAGEAREHPSPVLTRSGINPVGASNVWVSLVQPLGVGRVVRYHLEGTTFGGATFRHPAEGEESFVVKWVYGWPLGRLIAKLEGKK